MEATHPMASPELWKGGDDELIVETQMNWLKCLPLAFL